MGNAFPRPPGAKTKSGQVSVTKRDLEGEDFFVLKPKSYLEGGVGPHIFMADDRSSALHSGPPPRPPPFICTLFYTGIR